MCVTADKTYTKINPLLPVVPKITMTEWLELQRNLIASFIKWLHQDILIRDLPLFLKEYSNIIAIYGMCCINFAPTEAYSVAGIPDIISADTIITIDLFILSTFLATNI